MIPKITAMDVYPVAGHDSMELNLSGAHAPYFTRNVVVLEDSTGNLGVGEVPGGQKITRALEEVKELVRVTEECFFKGLEQAQPGNHIADISRAVQQHAEAHGYGVVRELVGHGIGSNMHEAPEVPNFTNIRMGRGARLVPGMAIAVEPMITLGARYINVLDDGWTCITADGKPAAHYENTIFITKDGPEVLTNPE